MLTLAFSQLVFSVAVKWRDVTGGTDGLAGFKRPALLRLRASTTRAVHVST